MDAPAHDAPDEQHVRRRVFLIPEGAIRAIRTAQDVLERDDDRLDVAPVRPRALHEAAHAVAQGEHMLILFATPRLAQHALEELAQARLVAECEGVLWCLEATHGDRLLIGARWGKPATAWSTLGRRRMPKWLNTLHFSRA